MKQINLYTLLLTLVFVAVGCTKSFVDKPTPYNQVPKDNYYKTEIEIKQAITGVYATLKSRYGQYWLLTEVPSDNSTYGTGGIVLNGEFDNFTYIPVTGALSNAWIGHYQTIANANIVLNRMSAVTMADAIRNRYTGELKFIRALMYFNLVRFFGEVPLITQELTNPADAYNFLRAPVADVYRQVETDLKESIPALPVSYTGADVSRVTSGAAKSLLAKVLMQQRKFAEALPYLQDVVSNETAAGYQLLPSANYKNVFVQDNNPEIVFSVQYENDGITGGSDFPSSFIPISTGTAIYAPPVSVRDNNLGTLDLFNAFRPDDIRKPIAIDKLPSSPDYFTRKFIVPQSQYGQEGNSDVDWPVIRYADVLLMFAETLNETGNTSGAIAQLNRIRTRAGLPNTGAVTQTEIRDSVLYERRLELCFEGHRWYDLIRAGKAVSTMQAFKTTYNVTNMITLDANRLLYPIPQRERNINPNLTQNTGY